MKVSFDYNLPDGNKYVTIYLGIANVNDVNYLFRFGTVQKKDKTKVYWHGPEEWLTSEQVTEVKVTIERGDLVVVDKKSKETGKISQNRWDTEEEWPPEAYGGSFTNMGYYL
jgi:hypothetical protein